MINQIITMKFVIISDTHIGGKFNEEMFNKGVEYVNKIDADYYIMTGDLVDQGTVAEYELVKNKYLPMFKKELLLIPGNHDVKNVGDLLWEEYIGPRFFVHTDEERKIRILGLDSNEPDTNTGRMGEKGIDRIYEEFQELGEEWMKVIAFHHQTLPIKYTGRERSALIDAGDTIKAIMDCNIDLVLNGHRHISNVYKLTDGDYPTLIVNCGTLSCKKTRYKEEYSLTTVEFNPEQSEARVDILKLNHELPMWVSKFRGSTVELGVPDDPGNLIATIVQIGNTDFSNNTFNLENYAKATQLINSINCDLVVHVGDVTAHSYKEEFEQAQALMAQIHKPTIVVPGPNDYFPLGYELFPMFIGDPNPTFENEKIKTLGFNSCILDEKIGRLGRSKSATIVNEFKDKSKVGITCFHHTIVPLPRSKHDSELQDAGDTLAMLADNNVDLVLTGAKNRSGCWQIDNTVFVNAWTVSSKNIVTAKGNSVNIILIYETKQGLYYKIDEYFVENGESEPIGRLHVARNSQ